MPDDPKQDGEPSRPPDDREELRRALANLPTPEKPKDKSTEPQDYFRGVYRRLFAEPKGKPKAERGEKRTRALHEIISGVFHWKHPGVLVAIFVAVGLAMASIGQNVHSAALVNVAFSVAYVAFAVAALWSIGSFRVSGFLEKKDPTKNPWDNLSAAGYKGWKRGGYFGIITLFSAAIVVTVLFHKDKLSSLPTQPSSPAAQNNSTPTPLIASASPSPSALPTPSPTSSPVVEAGADDINTEFGELRGDIGLATGRFGMEFDGCSKAKCMTEEGIASKKVVVDFNGKNSARIAVLLSTFPGPDGYSWDISEHNNVKISTSKEVSLDYAGRKREPPQNTLLFTLDDMYITTKSHDPEGFMVDITPHSKMGTIPLTIVAWANAMRRHTVTTTIVVRNFVEDKAIQQATPKPVETPRPTQTPIATPSTPSPQASPSYATVGIGIAVPNDETTSLRYPIFEQEKSWQETLVSCLRPAKCYTEQGFPQPMDLNVGDKGWARLIFVVFNTSDSVISHATANVVASENSRITIAHENQRPGGMSMEFQGAQTVDMVPYRMSGSGYDYLIDVTPDKTADLFALSFSIYSANLPAHRVTTLFRVIRPEPKEKPQ